MPKTAEIAGDRLIQTALQNLRAPKKTTIWNGNPLVKRSHFTTFSKASWDRINMADQSAAVFNFQKGETQTLTHFIHFFKLENIEKSFKDDCGYSNQIKFL